MAKETFHNLPVEKRTKIEEVAINEFAEFGYDKATVDHIVAKAKIPKGSFYQYFENKEDLFLYIALTVVGNMKMSYMAPLIQNSNKYDFYMVIKNLYVASAQFAKDHPQMMKIGTWLLNNQQHEMFKELLKQSSKNPHNMYSDLLNMGINQGEVRPDIDIAYISHLLPILMSATMEFCMKKDVKTGAEMFDDSIIMKSADLIIETMKYMLGTNASKLS